MRVKSRLFAVAVLALPSLGAAAKPADAGSAAFVMDAARERDLYLAVIRNLNDDGKGHAAIAYLDDYDQRYPADMRARLLRADCLAGTGEFVQAQALYQSLVADPVQAAAAYAGLGGIAAARGDWAGAAAAYRRAVALAPTQPGYRNDLGYALLRQDKATEALFILRQAHELSPGNARVRNNLLLALIRAGHRADADSMLRSIIDADDRRLTEAALDRVLRDARP